MGHTVRCSVYLEVNNQMYCTYVLPSTLYAIVQNLILFSALTFSTPSNCFIFSSPPRDVWLITKTTLHEGVNRGGNWASMMRKPTGVCLIFGMISIQNHSLIYMKTCDPSTVFYQLSEANGFTSWYTAEFGSPQRRETPSSFRLRGPTSTADTAKIFKNKIRRKMEWKMCFHLDRDGTCNKTCQVLPQNFRTRCMNWQFDRLGPTHATIQKFYWIIDLTATTTKSRSVQCIFKHKSFKLQSMKFQNENATVRSTIVQNSTTSRVPTSNFPTCYNATPCKLVWNVHMCIHVTGDSVAPTGRMCFSAFYTTIEREIVRHEICIEDFRCAERTLRGTFKRRFKIEFHSIGASLRSTKESILFSLHTEQGSPWSHLFFCNQIWTII